MGRAGGGEHSDEPLPDGIEQRLCDFADLVAQALANADAYEKLAASRARLVEVGDAERRRLERNLHDGAQQRLVSVALELSMVDGRLESDAEGARAILSTAREDLARGLEELRELARGIHPVVLTERGLGPALEALVTRAPLPVDVTGDPGGATVGATSRRRRTTSSPRRSRTSQVPPRPPRGPRPPPAPGGPRRAAGPGGGGGGGGADPPPGPAPRGLAPRIAPLPGRRGVAAPPGGGTRLPAPLPGREGGPPGRRPPPPPPGAAGGGGAGLPVALGRRARRLLPGAPRSEYDRPETIEETAELVDEPGGAGIAVAVDHLEPAEVRARRAHRRRAGRLDVLVNDIWGAERLKSLEWNTPVWEHDLDNGLRILRLAIDTHLITSHPRCRCSSAARRPGRRDDRRHARVQRRALPRLGVLRPRQDAVVLRLAFAQGHELEPHGARRWR